MERKRIVISGSSGLVGSRLVPYLQQEGFEVVRLVRRPATGAGEVQWDPARGVLDPAAIDGAHSVINLAGVSIAGKRWSEERKREILRSRIDATNLLARTIVSSPNRPSSFVSTSAVGYYGDGGNQVLTEQSPNGAGFLAAVCHDWEAAAQPAADAGIRVVHPRFGIVVAHEGGMIAQLKRLFGLGLGGRIGNGEQFMSWIDIDDLTRLLLRSVTDERLEGPVNAVAPNPATNREFTEAFGAAIGRPTVIPVPTFGIRAMLGQMGEELILVSQRAIPRRMLDENFEFRYPTIDRSLRKELGPSTRSHAATEVRAA